jgi:hypothetical protein
MIVNVKDKKINPLMFKTWKTKKSVECRWSSLNFKGQHDSRLGESKEEA